MIFSLVIQHTKNDSPTFLLSGKFQGWYTLHANQNNQKESQRKTISFCNKMLRVFYNRNIKDIDNAHVRKSPGSSSNIIFKFSEHWNTWPRSEYPCRWKNFGRKGIRKDEIATVEKKKKTLLFSEENKHYKRKRLKFLSPPGL